MDVSGWKERFKHRNDITTRITHLTNGDTPEKAFENLLSILEDRTIKGGHGYVSTLLIVEFGAGIHYNSKGNPKADEMGYGVGTFPGQIHAFEDGWYYWGEDEKWHYTHGIKATMPMYNASVAIREKVQECAKEVFG